MSGKTGQQHKSRQKPITERLSRDEAVAYLADALAGNPLPFRTSDYPGGAYEILADAVCLGASSIANSVSHGRRSLKKKYPDNAKLD